MATCAQKGCVYQAVSGKTFCQLHSPAPVTTKPGDDIEIVEIKAVPRTGRWNEAAMRLCGAIKALDSGHALKLKLAKFTKATLLCAVRYAEAEGVKTGIRITEESGFLWKLTDEEIKAREEKSARMRAAGVGRRKAAKAGR